MGFPVTIRDRTFTLSDFAGTAYTTGIRDAVEKLGDYGTRGFTGTSVTSNTIGTGSKSFTTQTWLPLKLGDGVRAASTASPGNHMNGVVTAYTPTSGALTVTFHTTLGSGTFASWNIIPICGSSTSVEGFMSARQGSLGANEPTYQLNVKKQNILWPEPAQGITVYTDFDENMSFTHPSAGNTFAGGWYGATTAAAALRVERADVADFTTTTGPTHHNSTQGILQLRSVTERLGFGLGKTGLFHPNLPGQLLYYTSIRLNGTSLDVANLCTFYAGLRGTGSSPVGNIFDIYGIGFEIAELTGNSTNREVVAVITINGVQTRYSLGFPSPVSYANASNTWLTLRIWINKSNRTVVFSAYSDSIDMTNPKFAPVADEAWVEAPLGTWPDIPDAMLHPYYGLNRVTTSSQTRKMYIDRLFVNQALRR